MAESRHIAETEINDYDNEQGEIQTCKGDIIDQNYVDDTFRKLFDESPSELEIDSIDDEWDVWDDECDVCNNMLLTDPNDDYNALENFGS